MTIDALGPESAPEPAAEAAAFHIVGIGASAGGLESLERFFTHIPTDSGMAFIVLQHLSPDFKSFMNELLSRRTPMAIRQAEHEMLVEPNTVYVIPMDPHMRVPPEGKLRVWRSKAGGNDWEPLSKGLPQKDCYVNVLRDAMAVDSLDKCGVYFGTTGGQVYVSPDGGDSWTTIVHDLPSVLSVEVQTLS